MSDPEVLHSPLGPSSSDRWINCPGSVAFTKDMPDEDSEYAILGTAAHTLSEWCREKNKPAKEFKNMLVPVKLSNGDTRQIEVDQVMVDGVQSFVDYVNEFDSDVEIIEERVHYTAWVENGWGTLDDGRIKDTVCRVTDLKFGVGIQVWAKNNTQLMLYALGLFQDYGHLYDIKTFILTIHQPRLDHVDTWEISTKDLIIWANEVAKPAAEEAHSSDARFAAGTWCTKGFCAARYTCGARAKWAQEQHLEDLEDLTSTRDPELLDDNEIARLLTGKSVALAFWGDLETYALSRLQQGNPVGDFKLVEGRSYRAWKDPAEAEKAMRAAKIKVKDMYVSKFVSPAQAEKVIGKKHTIMKEHVKKSPGKPVMVPGSDKREPLIVKAENEFEDLDGGGWDD